jgi:phosphoserine phosphatase RsbU/P
MADLKITQKIFRRKNLTTSIALRIFFISFIVVILPLLFHSFLVYKKEYSQKIKDHFISLNILGNSHKSLMEEEIDFYKTILTIIEKDIDLATEKNSFTINDYLKKTAILVQSKEIFYLSSEDKSLTCKFSSSEEFLKKDFSFLSDIVSKENMVFEKRGFLSSDCLYISHRLYEKDKSSGVIIIGVPISSFIKSISLKEERPYHIDMSLINAKNEIVFSSDKTLVGKIDLLSIKKLDNSFWLNTKNENRFAVKVPIQEGIFFILFDIAEKHILSAQKADFFFKFLSLTFFVVILGGGVAIWVIGLISKPLYQLFETMQKISQGDTEARFVKSGLGFEINILGDFFNSTIDSLEFQQKKAVEEQSQKIELQHELKIGRDIQLNMFPSEVLEIGNLDIAQGHLSAKEVSGDFYDLFEKDDKLFIAVADASGKGIGACLFSLSMRSSLRSFLTMSFNLEDIVKNANNLFLQDTKETGMFITAWLAIFDEKKNILYYTSCGHLGAILKKNDGKIIELQTEGIALGVEPTTKVEVKKIQLEEDDIVVIYTDGVTEALNLKKEHFGRARLMDIISKSSKDVSSDVLIKKLLEDIESFTKETSRSDDITVLVVKALPK